MFPVPQPNFSFARLERAYLQLQPVFGEIPNTSGTATLGNTNACRFTKMELRNDVKLLERPDKTGTRSQEGMTGGRKMGHWTMNMALVANGTAGVVPDCNPMLQAIFGQTATIGATSVSVTSSTDATPIVIATSGSTGVASGSFGVICVAGHLTNTNANGVWLAYANTSTSLTLCGSVGTGNGSGSGGTAGNVNCVYTFVDNISFFTLWSFRTPSTLDQRVGNTCVVMEATFNLNEDVATWQANGDCVWVTRSSAFSEEDIYQRGGLAVFPTEPAAPVTNGTIIPGFTGRFVAGQSVASSSASAFATSAYTFTQIRNATIRAQTTNALIVDTFGSYYPTSTEGDVRNISLTFNVYDDDSTETQLLKLWADNTTPVDFVINNGTVVGNIFVHYLKNVYLTAHVLGDGQLRFDAAFNDGRATTTNLQVRDEYSLIVD